MRLQELFKEANFDSVWCRLVEIYPDQSSLRDGYFSAFSKCLILEPMPSNMRIVFKSTSDGIEVSGCNGKTVRESEDLNYNNWLTDEQLDQEVTYALDFTIWSEWMDMVIDDVTLTDYTPIDIIVHCIWEMTFVSFREAERDNVLESIKEDVKKIESGEMKTYTSEEVFNRIREKLNLGNDNG